MEFLWFDTSDFYVDHHCGNLVDYWERKSKLEKERFLSQRKLSIRVCKPGMDYWVVNDFWRCLVQINYVDGISLVYKVNNYRQMFLITILHSSVIGALLSALIEPIYFTSIIIGSLYHSEHIRRALFARIEHVWMEFEREQKMNLVYFLDNEWYSSTVWSTSTFYFGRE